MRVLRALVRLCAGIGVLTLGASYLGALHPLGDSLAVFRGWIAGGVVVWAVLALFVRLWALGAVVLVLAVGAAVHLATLDPIVTRRIPVDPDVIVYAKNLGAGRVDWHLLARDIDDSDADVVTLQEVTRETLAALPDLLPDHPYQQICDFSGWSAMAVASRWPLSEPGCTGHRSLAYAVVATPSGPVWVASIHQVWPFPHEQAQLLPDILAAVEAAPTRQIIAGDFNMVPWGNSVHQIMDAGGTQRINTVMTTIEVRGIGLPIDHVLSDGWGIVNRRPRFGSDHYGLSARISWDGP